MLKGTSEDQIWESDRAQMRNETNSTFKTYTEIHIKKPNKKVNVGDKTKNGKVIK